MSIESKVSRVEHLFDRLDREISQFQSQAHLHCVIGCGKCCTKPDMEASPLEFLPWAFDLFINGQAEKVLSELNDSSNSICYLYQPLSLIDTQSGRCGNYRYRGLICRLFGYAATNDKYSKLRLIACKIIKENHLSFKSVEEVINRGLYVPVFTDYYMNLSQIDFRLGNTILPINKALKGAIEEVLHYFTYRPFPKGFKNVS